jgi:hypothetical protein
MKKARRIRSRCRKPVNLMVFVSALQKSYEASRIASAALRKFADQLKASTQYEYRTK